MKRSLGIITILVGLSIILFPTIQSKVQDRKQDELLIAYKIATDALGRKNDKESDVITSVIDLNESEQVTQIVESPKAESEFIVIDINNDMLDETKLKLEIEPEKEPEIKKEERNSYISSLRAVEGVLEIESIDFLMPIVIGATSKNLDVSISSLDGMSKPWETGNYAIAGHRSLKYGRHFNRLNELTNGDIMTIRDMNEVLHVYEVYSILLVHETDLSVLENNDFDELTLITCDPVGAKNPEFRLIVKGKKNSGG